MERSRQSFESEERRTPGGLSHLSGRSHVRSLAGYAQVPYRNNRSSFNGFDLVDKTRNIRKPAGYRDQYQALGVFTILDSKGDEMHYTHASPGTAEHYRNTGKFADGAVLVKEMFGTNHGPMTTGDGHWGVRHQGVVSS